MYSWRNFADKFKRYGKLEGFEKRGLLIAIVVMSFIFSFREWGTETFDFVIGLQNLVITAIIVVVAMAVHEFAHRFISLQMGYRSQYKVWILGLIIGLVVAFVSNGHWLFLAPGALVITHMQVHRLGKFYYDLNYKDLGWIAMSGAIANMLFAVLLKVMHVATGFGFFEKAMMINIWIALFDMLPVPHFNGARTFFGSRYVYIFVLGALAGCAALLSFVDGLLAIFGGLVIGGLLLFVFFGFIDKKW